MLKGFFQKNKATIEGAIDEKKIDPFNIPKHVAIIMDGNGRWAKKKGLPRIAGHRAGMNAVIEITKAASDLGIKVLTLYAFSTENWKRPEDEVSFLMNLPQEFLLGHLDDLKKNNVQVKIMGFTSQLPPHTLEAVIEAERKTAENTGLVLNFALNYGSRYEIVQATKNLVDDVASGKLTKEMIDEEVFSSYLLTKNFSDPDLLIRTSGEQRISNFLLWQLAYTELWFTSVYWPQFNKQILIEAIYDYQQRSRRFGGV